MKKVFTLAPNENWIVDRFVSEWNQDNSDMSVDNPQEADVLWLLGSWCWRRFLPTFLASKKVLTTVHHIVQEKFDDSKKREFSERDEVTSAYHVYNKQTKDFISDYTKKPIHVIDYWANSNIWKKSDKGKYELRKSYGLPSDAYLIGSFQRDSEGMDVSLPKLEKGPDLFADYVEHLTKEWDFWRQGCGYTSFRYPHVVLAGWRRNYLINRLESSKIPYSYFELPNQIALNHLYQCLDLYAVSSRVEGGPQALIECGLLGVPVVSTNVGIARKVLPETSVNNKIMLAVPAVPNVESWKIPNGYKPFRDILQSL